MTELPALLNALRDATLGARPSDYGLALMIVTALWLWYGRLQRPR